MTEVAGEPDGKRRGLLGASFVVSLGTTLSRVLGLCRDVVLANLLGAAPNADAFFVAFKIPNFFIFKIISYNFFFISCSDNKIFKSKFVIVHYYSQNNRFSQNFDHWLRDTFR